MVSGGTGRCAGVNADGEPCEAGPVRPDGYCWWHSPTAAEAREAKRREGGRNRSNAARARRQVPTGLTAAQLHGAMSAVFGKVVKGELEPAVGVAAMTIARGLVELHRAAELEATVADLARRLGERLA